MAFSQVSYPMKVNRDNGECEVSFADFPGLRITVPDEVTLHDTAEAAVLIELNSLVSGHELLPWPRPLGANEEGVAVTFDTFLRVHFFNAMKARNWHIDHLAADFEGVNYYGKSRNVEELCDFRKLLRPNALFDLLPRLQLRLHLNITANA